MLIDTVRRLTDLTHGLILSIRFAHRDQWTRAQLAAHQREAFGTIVRHAATATRFYGDLYRGIPLGEVTRAELLPPTNKKLLMDHFADTISGVALDRGALEEHLANLRGDAYFQGEYRIVATAGTSGLRGIFVYDRPAWRVVLANTLRWQAFSGIRPRLPNRIRICSIGADMAMHVTNRIPLSGNVGLFVLHHIEAIDPIPRQVEELNRFQPDVLLPYPSIAAQLAREQIEGRLRIQPRVVATHSELLTPDMRRLITEAWGAQPFNHYGLTEEPHLAAECGAHTGMHVFDDTSLIEIMDDDLRPVPDGVMGTRYLLTNLYNKAQPVIRYEVTDMIRRATAPCQCGRPFALLDSIGGRAEDMLSLPRLDGNGQVPVTPMVISLAIESFIGVRDYAAEHDSEGMRIRLVVPDAGARAPIEAGLLERLRADISHLGALPPPISITFESALDRSAQRMGKHSVVSHRRAPAIPAG